MEGEQAQQVTAVLHKVRTFAIKGPDQKGLKLRKKETHVELFKLLPNWRSFRKVLNRTILTTFVFLFLQIKRKAIKNPGKSTGDLPDFLSAFLNRSCPYEIQEPDLSCDR